MNHVAIIGQTCRAAAFGAGFSPIERQTGIWRLAYRCRRFVALTIGGAAFPLVDRDVHLRDVVAETLDEALALTCAIEGSGPICLYEVCHQRDPKPINHQ